MKRSEILFRILVALFAAVVVVVFVIPQETLNENELIFLWIIMPILGSLWIRMLIDLTNGN